MVVLSNSSSQCPWMTGLQQAPAKGLELCCQSEYPTFELLCPTQEYLAMQRAKYVLTIQNTLYISFAALHTQVSLCQAQSLKRGIDALPCFVKPPCLLSWQLCFPQVTKGGKARDWLQQFEFTS